MAGMIANWDVAEPVSTHNSVNETDTFKRNVDVKNVKKVWRNVQHCWRRVTNAWKQCPPPQTPPSSRPGRKGSRERKTSVLTQSISNSD